MIPRWGGSGPGRPGGHDSCADPGGGSMDLSAQRRRRLATGIGLGLVGLLILAGPVQVQAGPGGQPRTGGYIFTVPGVERLGLRQDYGLAIIAPVCPSPACLRAEALHPKADLEAVWETPALRLYLLLTLR